MGAEKPYDAIGIVNFILWVPITLVICLTILKSVEIWNFIKILISNAEDYIPYFVVLIITIVLIFISIFIYIQAVHSLQQSYAVGQRMQDDCKNIYAIHNTANYQLYATITDTTMSNPIKKMNAACLILYIVIILVFISIAINNYYLHKSSGENLSDEPWKNFVRFGIPFISIITVIGGIVKLSKNINTPDYVKETFTPRSLIVAFIFILIGLGIQTYFQETYGKLQPFTGILLLICIVAIILIYITLDNDLNTSTLNKYKCLADGTPSKNTCTQIEGITDLQTEIENIGKKDGTTYGVTFNNNNLTQFSHLPFPPKTPFTRYLMENIKAIPKWNYTNPPDTEPLWPYVLNEANGMELNNFYLQSESDSTLQNLIVQFRKNMSNLRKFKDFGNSLDSLATKAYVLIIILVTLLVYPIFNILYKNDPILITYIVGIALIVLLCISCLIGFISKILP